MKFDDYNALIKENIQESFVINKLIIKSIVSFKMTQHVN